MFKYGNRLLFAGDLERHLKNLDHTKSVLLTRVSNMRLRDSDQKDSTAQETRKNAENELHRALQSIHQSTSEIKDILSILKPLLVLLPWLSFIPVVISLYVSLPSISWFMPCGCYNHSSSSSSFPIWNLHS